MRKKTREEIELAKSFQETNIAARAAIRSINTLKRTLSGQFITPDIDRDLKAAIKVIEKIKYDSAEGKSDIYLFKLKNA